MIKYENECVSCGLPCFNGCSYRKVPHLYCDKCGLEAETLYRSDSGLEVCEDCLKSLFKKVEV